MKTVLIALLSLAGSTLAMPPTQRQDRCIADADQKWSKLWSKFCTKEYMDAQEGCKNETNGSECESTSHKTAMECLVNHSKASETSQSLHDTCKARAVKDASVCFHDKDNTKKTLQMCQQEKWEAYFPCIETGGARPVTAQDTEYDKIWRDYCLKGSQESKEKCRTINDYGEECARAGVDNDMKCLVDHIKAPGTSDFIHGQCQREAVVGVRDCFYQNNKGKTLPKCQREHWNAYPECVKKSITMTSTSTSTSTSTPTSTSASTPTSTFASTSAQDSCS